MGHAAVVIEAGGSRILIDPGVFSPDQTFELEHLDAIVATHQHPDHLDASRLGGLLDRNPGATLLCDPETADVVEHGSWTAHTDGDETTVGSLTVRGVGDRHAEIVPQIPRVTNTGVLLSGPGEPTFFHPGDSYEHAPAGADVLALPLTAPWTKIRETVEFIAQVSPAVLFPVHDAAITDLAYGIYWGHVENFGGVADARRLASTESTTVE
jgi:L-ascorbate metabolism protein UlaG (beta-lactamase superfamily)